MFRLKLELAEKIPQLLFPNLPFPQHHTLSVEGFVLDKKLYHINWNIKKTERKGKLSDCKVCWLFLSHQIDHKTLGAPVDSATAFIRMFSPIPSSIPSYAGASYELWTKSDQGTIQT